MDAALDAMAPFGFSQELVSQTVKELLRVYGNDGWVFFEEASYKLLIDTILDKQTKISEEKDASLEDGARDRDDVAEPSNGVFRSTRSRQEDASTICQTNGILESASVTNESSDSISLTNDSAAKNCLPPPQWAKKVSRNSKLDLNSGKSNVDSVEGHIVKDSSLENPQRNTLVCSQQLVHAVPIQIRKPCHGWISDDDDDLMELSPETLPEQSKNMPIGWGGKRKRKSRWDVRPEDISCRDLRFQPCLAPSTSSHLKRCVRSRLKFNSVLRKRQISTCRATETRIEPDSNDDKEKEVRKDGPVPPSTDSYAQDSSLLDSEPAVSEKINNNYKNNAQLNNNVAEDSTQGGVQEIENAEVASGSPLPGVKPQQLDELIKIPKETIEVLKSQVFGFDTFFVTGQDPYEGGVLFKGNLRGQAAKSYEKIAKRMQDKFGDEYKLFLLVNPEDDRPVAVVVPRKTLQPETTAVPEWFAAWSFGLVTVFTLLLRNVPALQSSLLSTFDNLELLKNGAPGTLVTALILGVHELAHILVANSTGVKLGVPYFVPSWQIGSFGAITRILNIVPKREDLLKVAVAGPLAGFVLGLILLLLGLILPPSDGIGIVVDASVFHESFLAGGIAKLLLGDVLKESTPISVNPLVIWAWAGLLINAINSIPAGELDGGRISFAIWGRKASMRFTGASIGLLGLSALVNDVAFYWVLLIFFLQRGPIAPLSEEITDPDDKRGHDKFLEAK
ncbi:hypothetical protein FNV43_RR24600 [Rhamnella rubrinervis]|uniref:Uncharacterized protein n=1 Tax=Rhamnella rubrinervis TaxID=2594499 RepID=A0A8K0GQV1_9ROSA|nr:hypothetical protein FNV43_RR24600 [Rhamnella rubrinervis]